MGRKQPKSVGKWIIIRCHTFAFKAVTSEQFAHPRTTPLFFPDYPADSRLFLLYLEHNNKLHRLPKLCPGGVSAFQCFASPTSAKLKEFSCILDNVQNHRVCALSVSICFCIDKLAGLLHIDHNGLYIRMLLYITCMCEVAIKGTPTQTGACFIHLHPSTGICLMDMEKSLICQRLISE